MNIEALRKANQQEGLLFVPLALMMLAFLLMTGFQTFVLMQEHKAIDSTLAKQKPVAQQAAKMRTQLDSIAQKTALLAQAGNANAQTLVDQLKAAGITINFEAPREK